MSLSIKIKREITAIAKSQKGLGLIEIVIALLIFGVGVTAAIRTLPVSNNTTTRARNLTRATNLAQQKIEELIGSQYNSAELSAGTHNDPQNPLELHFTRTWTVTDDNPLPDMKNVTVTVTYESGSNDNSVTLATYITSRR
jgi:prepilin-type N-terminal cleavage/methylation domain-containing protein